MPRINKFSGLSIPDKDVCVTSSPENIKRFREATLKLDRIHNFVDEEALTENIIQLCIRYNRANLDISWDMDYPHAMDMLEEVYNDVDANMMIMAVEMLATRYGYTEEMDHEVCNVDLEMFWHTRESLTSLLARIQNEYNSLNRKSKDAFLNKIAGGMRSYEINKYNARPSVERRQIWVVETPYGVGSETTGYRWAIVISNAKHAKISYTANVVYLHGLPAANEKCHLEITDSDLEDGALDKNPSSVILTDIFTVDRKRFKYYKGKVSDKFMAQLMKRIAKQLGITRDLCAAVETEEDTNEEAAQVEETTNDDVVNIEEIADTQQELVKEADS